MSHRIFSTLSTVSVVLAWALGPTAPASANQCVHPTGNVPIARFGDLDGSSKTDVGDVMCGLLRVTWLQGGVTSPPACLSTGASMADANCNGTTTVGDVQLIVKAALSLPLGLAIDPDGDGCPDACVPCALPCTDNNACTADSCDIAAGCIFSPLSCSDGNLCTSDSCSPSLGCQHSPVSCNDSNLCTDDLCSPATGCSHLPVDCDDAIDCTADSCSGGTCSNVPDDALCAASGGGSCDPPNGDPLTGCVETGPPAYCSSPGSFIVCQATTITAYAGAPSLPAGNYIVCPIRVAAISQSCTASTCQATAFQWNLEWDATKATIYDFFDVHCYAANMCYPVARTSLSGLVKMSLSTGHSLSISPSTGAAWNANAWSNAEGYTGVGRGFLLGVHTTNLSAVLSPAKLSGALGSTMTGDPQIFDAYFKPVGGYNPATAGPFQVCLRNVVLTKSTSADLTVQYDTVHGALVTSQ